MREGTAGADGNPAVALGANAFPADPWRFQRWSYEQRTGNVARKAVLMALAVMADMETGRCEAKHETLAQWVEVSRRSVVRHVQTLREAGLVATRRQYRQDGSRRGDEFLLLAPWVAEWPDGESIQSDNGGQSANLSPGQSANGSRSKVPARARSVSSLSQQEQPLENDHLENNGDRRTDHRESWGDGIPDCLRADAESLLESKVKVGARLVTDAEIRIAAAALAEFNRQAESDYGLGAQVTRMVMRIRERPSWDAAKHVRLVQSAWRVRWWESRGGRRPEPRVIYGNQDVFEKVAQDAMDEAAARRELAGDRGFRGKRWPDGRSFDELTPAEQAQAREAVTMGLRPWEEREAPPQRVNGHSNGSVSAATILDGP